uniref:Prefoldin, alpha subunit n=1 Tax=Globisporangium ultimum (strain ATCC 200006 / CBS 805.95 / DAOM BR144) TaxID=431595 RepID=K3WP87_GLOUD
MTTATATAGGESPMEALQKYSAFVEEVLKPQLKQTLAKRDEISSEMAEYQELLVLIHDFQAKQAAAHDDDADEEEETKCDSDDHKQQKSKSTHLIMDLGQKFHVRAKIADPTMITVDIGLHFHVEMTLEEARQFVNHHLVYLTQKRDEWQQKARQVSDHVNVVIEAIQKLVALQQV